MKILANKEIQKSVSFAVSLVIWVVYPSAEHKVFLWLCISASFRCYC